MAIDVIPLQKKSESTLEKVSNSIKDSFSSLKDSLSPFVKTAESNKKETQSFQKKMLKINSDVFGFFKNTYMSAKAKTIAKLKYKWVKYQERVRRSKWYENALTNLKKAGDAASSGFLQLLKALLILLIIDPSGGFIASIIKFAGKMVAWVIRILIKHIPILVKAFVNLITNVLPPALKEAFNTILDSMEVPKDHPLRMLVNAIADAAPQIIKFMIFFSLLKKLGMAGGPLTLAIAGIGLLATELYRIYKDSAKIIKKWDKDSKKYLKNLKGSQKKAGKVMIRSMDVTLAQYAEVFKKKGIKGVFKQFGKELKMVFKGIGSKLSDIGKSIKNKFSDIGKVVSSFFSKIGSIIKDKFVNAGSAISTFFSKLGTNTKSKLNIVWQNVKDFFGTIVDYIKALVNNPFDEKSRKGEFRTRQIARATGIDYDVLKKQAATGKFSGKGYKALRTLQTAAGSTSRNLGALESSVAVSGDYRYERAKKAAKDFNTGNSKTKGRSRG